MSRLFVRFLNVSLITPNFNASESTMYAIFALVIAAALSTPAFAATPDFTTFEISTPQYGVGVPVIDATAEANATCAAYAQCVDDKGSCEIMVLGSSSDSEHFDLTRWPEYTAEANLAGARASNFSRQINTQCQRMNVPLNWDHVHMVPPNPHAAAQYRYAVAGVRPTVDGGTASAMMPPVPANPDERWGFATGELWKYYNDLRPVILELDPVAQTVNDRTSRSWDKCLEIDASASLPGIQFYSEEAGLELYRSSLGHNQGLRELSWTDTVIFFRNAPMGTNEVDSAGSLVSRAPPDAGGLGVRFEEIDGHMYAYWPDRCTPILRERELKAEADALATAQSNEEVRIRSYGLDWYARGNFVPGYIDRTPLSPYSYSPGSTIDGIIESGLKIGLGQYRPVSIVAGGMFDVGHDPDCIRPAVVGWGAVAGFDFNNPYRFGGEVNAYYLRSGAPYPDGDDTNLDLQRERVGVRGGPRVTLFGEGTHGGYFGIDGFIQADFLKAVTPESGMTSNTAVPAAGAWLYFGVDL